MEKDKWKDDILESIRGLKRAEPNPFLFTRIEANLNAKRTERVFTFNLKLAVSLCTLVLIANTMILLNHARTGVKESLATGPDYQLSKSNYQLY